jgi:hypothetical protein
MITRSLGHQQDAADDQSRNLSVFEERIAVQ